MASDDQTASLLESGQISKDMPNGHGHGETNLGGANGEILPRRKLSELPLIRIGRSQLAVVILGTKLWPLFAAVVLAAVAQIWKIGEGWVFLLSLTGLVPLAERVSFLSEHIAHSAGPTAGGLLNATCGNVPELIIALLALHNGRMDVLKWSLTGSILSNLLLVLGSSLFCGGVVNKGRELPFSRKQADVSVSLLLLGAICHVLVMIYKWTSSAGSAKDQHATEMSRASGFLMLLAYAGGLLFQLKTHRQLYEAQEDDENEDEDTSTAAALGLTSSIMWLIIMTAVIGVLSDYVVTTIEAASATWRIPVRFVSIILLPIAGNAAEHASAIIFAIKNKLDITLGVALGSATQISMLVVPVTVLAAWVKGVNMDLDFNFLETGSLVASIFLVAITLQDEQWHYMKGFILLLCYAVISVCFFLPTPP